MIKNWIAALLAMSCSVLSATAAGGYVEPSFMAKVVSVHDGDTLTVYFDNTKIKIRLADIDAPELDQDAGGDAKDMLELHCLNERVKIKPKGVDKYGRVIATVYLPGQAETMQEFMLNNGLAWVYPMFCERSKYMELTALESNARACGRGLWGFPGGYTPPWIWRKTSHHDYCPSNTVDRSEYILESNSKIQRRR